MKKLQQWSLKSLFIGVMLFSLTACAQTGGTMVHHHFSFDTRDDSPGVHVMDFQYGDSRQFGTQADRESVALGHDLSTWFISGVIPRGDFLYVKWRIKDPINPGKYTGPYEDKVDLRNRLPADITDLRIHFVPRGSQLYIYLIWPDKKDASEPEGPIKMYKYQKQVQIYPDQTK